MTADNIILSGITIYPVKSCAGIALQHSRLDELGLEYDRRWMVVDKQGKFLSQRSHPKMALIQTELKDGGLLLSSEGMPDLAVPKATSSMPRLKVGVWDDRVEALHLGEECDQWLSKAIGETCRLVVLAPDMNRQVDLQYADHGDHTAFTDGFPLLLISEASLEDLNSRLETALDMRHFRPNLVVSGCEPYAEDGWESISIGNARMNIVKPCSRCVITTVDPDTGEKSSAEPLRTLTTYRRSGNKVYFGQNVIHRSNGKLTVGDRCNVTESSQAARISFM